MFDKICSPRVEWRINFVPACSSPSEWISSNRKHSRPSRRDSGPVYHIYRSKEDENKLTQIVNEHGILSNSKSSTASPEKTVGEIDRMKSSHRFLSSTLRTQF
jgi:hypothetical protein